MFMKELKSSLVLALRQTFDGAYEAIPAPLGGGEDDFQNLWVDIEFPVEPQQYPSIWVDFDPTGELQIAGVDHQEFTEEGKLVRRWTFQGMVQFTVVALTSLERDRLFDEVVRIVAFAFQNPKTSAFRNYIESNPLIATDIDWDQITVSGSAATPGTPWGSDDFIYEVTVQLSVVGEFVSDPSDGTLVALTSITVTPYSDRESDPGFPSGP